MKKQRFIFLFWIMLMMASACAAPNQSGVQSGNPAQWVSQLESDLAAAKSDQVDVLAPGLYRSAQSSFSKAKEALDKGARLSDIRDHVAEGQTRLKKAEEIAKVSRTILSQTNEAREKALKAGADRLGKPYQEVENQYLNLTKAIENDNLSGAQKDAPKVQAAFRNVEIMAIKNNALDNARKMMAKAEMNKVQKIAPKSYQDALQALNAADAFIGQNLYAADAIKEKAAHAEFMAQRLTVISERSKRLETMTPESSALYVEDLLTRLGGTMKTGDLRDQDAESQINRLKTAFETLQRENQSLASENQNCQTHIAALENRLSGLQGYSRTQEEAKEKLAAEREFNERFNQVQRFFSPSEAEVYKQGGRLVIRMRGIQFPVGQAILTPENYSLLSKVQKAIQTFGQPTVTIEGHTDSTGSAQTNLELSRKRAEAVKSYLVANNTLPGNRIQATGYGPDRPLAPNTTPEGRAVNRRIDVLIAPSQTP